MGRALSRAITALNDVIAIQEAELVGLRSAEDRSTMRQGSYRNSATTCWLWPSQERGGDALWWTPSTLSGPGVPDGSLASQLATITARVDRQLAAGPKSYDEQAILSELERDVNRDVGPGCFVTLVAMWQISATISRQ